MISYFPFSVRFILAASSRPDMLDSALLRPGRLDKLMYIGFPDSPKKREDILRVSCKAAKLSRDADVVIREIAEQETEYSGADLQAVITTVQLIAAREALQHVKEGGALLDEVIIQGSHITSARHTCRPSVSKKERARYEKIYSQFWKARGGDNKKGFNKDASVQESAGQRTSLAYT